MYYRLDENKNAIPCNIFEWSEQRENMRKNKTKHVNDETLHGKRISTVWIGLDHNMEDSILPLIFETMVFDGREEIYCDRYSTWKEAEEGHQKAVEWVNNGCKDEDNEQA